MDFPKILKNIIHEDSFQLQSQEKEQLIAYMLEHIGSIDPNLRDTLIYNAFNKLILGGQLDEADLLLLTETIISHNYLLFNVGSYIQTDEVFTRTFSSLVLVLCIMQHEHQPFFTPQLAQKVEKAMKQYLINETDYRGYIPSKGWAHSVAHSADLLHTAFEHQSLFPTITYAFSKTILQKWLLQPNAFIDDEHNRMVNVVIAMLQNGWTTNELSQWLNVLQQANAEDAYTAYRISWNVRQFIIVLYLKTKHNNTLHKVIAQHI